ncbi:hypothetical protein [uncultured Desulfovibrio sp.]|jgi:hypothetical protein|nr:hypothetical protein [uncultured Desulfovibrio sp.]
MSGKTTFFPRNDGGEQIENLYCQSRNAIKRMQSENAPLTASADRRRQAL